VQFPRNSGAGAVYAALGERVLDKGNRFCSFLRIKRKLSHMSVWISFSMLFGAEHLVFSRDAFNTYGTNLDHVKIATLRGAL
jgi:hypothetical protein